MHRFRYLDGLRGVAALYVMATHVMTELNQNDPPTRQSGAHWYSFGLAAVSVFIVLSGYCLTLPISVDQTVNARRFLLRRCVRILPPYFAALALTLLLILLRPPIVPYSFFWHNAARAFQPGVLLSHLLLVHNLNASWALMINLPMWSIATEWQIYFLFPALLWAYRKLGPTAPISIAFVAGIGLTGLVSYLNHGHETGELYFLGLFALGICACLMPEKPAPYGWLTIGLIGLILFLSRHGMWYWTHQTIANSLVGCAACSLILYCRSADSVVRRVLESRLIAGIGLFSYSLYLMHVPFLGFVHLWTPHVALVGVPVCLAGSYLFYLVFERPFINWKRSQRAQAR